jgi:hypothetical protein
VTTFPCPQLFYLKITFKCCFVTVLQFDSSGIITGMESIEGEHVKFYKTVNPNVTAVEWWLLEAEHVIKQTLHTVSGSALEAYPTKARSEWILDWPGQLVLNCSQVYWTKVCLSSKKQLFSYASYHLLNEAVCNQIVIVHSLSSTYSKHSRTQMLHLLQTSFWTLFWTLAQYLQAFCRR